MCEPTDQCISSVETLDMEGDVIIVIQGDPPEKKRSFLLSSKVLGLASPVFLKMFEPKFSEGQQLANSDRPEIALYEDDPAIMGVIFSILHYQEPEEMSEMKTQWLATFAIHCDKYDCTKALWPHVRIWLQVFKEKMLTPNDHGNLLLAAYLSRDSQQFTTLSREAQLKLPVAFPLEWEKSEILNRMPDTVILQLSERIESLLDSMEREIYSVEKSLRAHEARHAIQTKDCGSCGRTIPAMAHICQTCNNCYLQSKFCTSDYRISQYFLTLQKASIWPSSKPFRTLSASEITSSITLLLTHLQPDCATGELCPLKEEMEKLIKVVHTLLKQAEGLSLSDIQTL